MAGYKGPHPGGMTHTAWMATMHPKTRSLPSPTERWCNDGIQTQYQSTYYSSTNTLCLAVGISQECAAAYTPN